jgi:RecB family exonuclease
VPLDWPRERPLRQNPLVRALLCAAQSCRSRWNIHELHDLFGDGTLQLHLGENRFDARRLRAAGRAARHPELDDLDSARAAFEAKIAQFTAHPKIDEAAARAAIEASLVAGDLEIVAHFQALCANFGEKIGASAWQIRFFELIESLAGHWLEIDEESSPEPAQIVARNAIARLQGAIETVVERARGWSDGDEEPERAASEWLRWLEAEIDAAPLQENVQHGGVRVGSASAPPTARHTVFFCGLSEGAWPASIPDGPLGAQGREMGRILRVHESAPIARASHVLARALGEENRVSLSHAAFIGGRETPPSPVWDDLHAAWPGEKWPQLAPAEGGEIRSRRAFLTALNSYLNADSPAETSEPDFAHLQTLWEMRAQRRDSQMGVYDGVLGTRGRVLMEQWSELRRSNALSGSALEFYARCPLRYFFERVLGLGEDEEIDDDLDARAAGNLAHEITRAFLENWMTAFSGADFEAALQKLTQIVRAECDKLPLRSILRDAEFHRLMGADERSGPLVKWLQHEISLGNGAWLSEMRPLLHLPTGIDGVSTGLEHRFRIEIGGHELSGVIDRLDMAPDGSQIAVIDYKTGDVSGLPSWKAGDSGLHFQLAVYALAARHLTRHLDPKSRLSMAYLTLRRAKIARGIGQEGTLGKGCSGAKLLNDREFEAWLEDVSVRAARIADLRRAGTFNLSVQNAKDAKCATCGSKKLCGQHAPTQASRLETHLDSPFFYAPKLRVWELES